MSYMGEHRDQFSSVARGSGVPIVSKKAEIKAHPVSIPLKLTKKPKTNFKKINKTKILLSPLKLFLPHKIIKTLVVGSAASITAYLGLCALVQMDRVSVMPMSVSCNIDLTQGRTISGSASFTYNKDSNTMVRHDTVSPDNIFGNDVIDPVQAVGACNQSIKDWRYGFEDLSINVNFGQMGSYIDTKDYQTTINWREVRRGVDEFKDKTDRSLYALSAYDSPDITDDISSILGEGIAYVSPDFYEDSAEVLGHISTTGDFLSSGFDFLRGQRGMNMRGYCEIWDKNDVSYAFTTASDASAIVEGEMNHDATRVATVPEMMQACYTQALDLGLKANDLRYVYTLGNGDMFGRRHSDIITDNSLRDMREMTAMSQQDYKTFTGPISQHRDSLHSLKLRIFG